MLSKLLQNAETQFVRIHAVSVCVKIKTEDLYTQWIATKDLHNLRKIFQPFNHNSQSSLTTYLGKYRVNLLPIRD